MNERETSQDFSSDLFDPEERSVLHQIQREGTLDSDREVSRLLNILNDILNEHTILSPEDHEFVYQRLKRFLKFEYHKMIQYELEYDERYVWYLSTLTCLDQVKKQLSTIVPESREEVLLQFNSVINEHMKEYMSKFSDRNNVRDIGAMLEPKFEDITQLVNYSGVVDQSKINMPTKKQEIPYIVQEYESDEYPDEETPLVI